MAASPCRTAAKHSRSSRRATPQQAHIPARVAHARNRWTRGPGRWRASPRGRRRTRAATSSGHAWPSTRSHPGRFDTQGTTEETVNAINLQISVHTEICRGPSPVWRESDQPALQALGCGQRARRLMGVKGAERCDGDRGGHRPPGRGGTCRREQLAPPSRRLPQPVGGTAASPTFSLAEVEDWLRGQGKLADSPVRERVWQTLRSAAARTPTSPTCSPSPAPASSGCGTNPAVT